MIYWSSTDWKTQLNIRARSSPGLSKQMEYSQNFHSRTNLINLLKQFTLVSSKLERLFTSRQCGLSLLRWITRQTVPCSQKFGKNKVFFVATNTLAYRKKVCVAEKKFYKTSQTSERSAAAADEGDITAAAWSTSAAWHRTYNFSIGAILYSVQ